MVFAHGQKQQQRGGWGAGSDGAEHAAPAPKVPNAKSILPRDEPTIWFEAASTLPALPPAREEAAPEVVAQRRAQAERLLLVEEQVGAGCRASQCVWFSSCVGTQGSKMVVVIRLWPGLA